MRRDNEDDFRLVRLQELILEELRGLLRDDISDPTLEGVFITALVLSVDYRHARLHFAVRGTEEAARRRRVVVGTAFARATPFIRVRLAQSIEMKRVPELRFVFDGAVPDTDVLDMPLDREGT